jgi:DNA-directed RNA polymerase specialized sigma24 family protein
MSGDCLESGRAGAVRAEHTALELFQLAALMVGEEEQALKLVEESVSAAGIDPCADIPAAEEAAKSHLARRALVWMKSRDPESFARVDGLSQSAACVDTDDVEASGLSGERLARLLEGARRQELRAWLDQLPMAQRAIFVQRAVMGRDSRATADAMTEAAGSGGWNSDSVSQTFRAALCSLANQLAHSTSGAIA